MSYVRGLNGTRADDFTVTKTGLLCRSLNLEILASDLGEATADGLPAWPLFIADKLGLAAFDALPYFESALFRFRHSKKFAPQFPPDWYALTHNAILAKLRTEDESEHWISLPLNMRHKLNTANGAPFQRRRKSEKSR